LLSQVGSAKCAPTVCAASIQSSSGTASKWLGHSDSTPLSSRTYAGDDPSPSVGAVVGTLVGDLVGLAVGKAVGLMVGDVLGAAVGDAVGAVVVATVGSAVGALVDP